MAMNRYARVRRLMGGSAVGSNRASSIIFNMVENGSLTYTVRVLQGKERLDILAGKIYGNSNLWWVIAAASGIGWAMQVPPGTMLRIPSDLGKISGMIG